MLRYVLVSTLFFSFFSVHAFADSPCFDFTKPSVTLLKPAPDSFSDEDRPNHSGTDDKNNDWGEVGGIVKKPIVSLFKKLQDPKTIRNGDNTRVEVTAADTKDFLKKMIEKIVVKPVFFITIDWQEEWAFGLKKGTADQPEEILISYQKTQGTSHIKHLCGNILLRSLSPTATGVYLYEEVQADRRSAQDVLNGIQGTLRTLRE